MRISGSRKAAPAGPTAISTEVSGVAAGVTVSGKFTSPAPWAAASEPHLTSKCV